MSQYRVISTLSTKSGYKYPGDVAHLAMEPAQLLVRLGMVVKIEDEDEDKIEDDIENEEKNNGSDN